MDQILVNSVNQATREDPTITGSLETLIAATYKKFVENKVDDFPRMCQVAMMQNKLRAQELEQNGNIGKYTGTTGWSKDGTMKWEFDIPQELYLFMKCMVYKGFWDKDNERVKRAFMNAICRGDDPMTLLMKVKSYYGSNKDASLTT